MSATCIDCPFFQSFGENTRSWCAAFNRMAREYHQQTQDCEHQIADEEAAIASDELTERIIEEKIAVTPVLVALVLDRLSPNNDERIFPADITDISVQPEAVLAQAGNRLIPICIGDWNEAIAQIQPSNMGAHTIACPSCAGDDCSECNGDRALPVEIDAKGKTYRAWAGYRLLGTFFQTSVGWWMISPAHRNDRAFRYYYTSREAVEVIALCWKKAQQRQRHQRRLTLLK